MKSFSVSFFRLNSDFLRLYSAGLKFFIRNFRRLFVLNYLYILLLLDWLQFYNSGGVVAGFYLEIYISTLSFVKYSSFVEFSGVYFSSSEGIKNRFDGGLFDRIGS